MGRVLVARVDVFGAVPETEAMCGFMCMLMAMLGRCGAVAQVRGGLHRRDGFLQDLTPVGDGFLLV